MMCKCNRMDCPYCNKPKVTSERIMSQEFPRGKKIDALLDRDCVILDGNCDCPAPALYNCRKYPNGT